jgi:hypothetical protein
MWINEGKESSQPVSETALTNTGILDTLNVHIDKVISEYIDERHAERSSSLTPRHNLKIFWRLLFYYFKNWES